MKKVLVLDFGGQYNLLVARRVRECGVYCEIKPYTMSMDDIRSFGPAAIIFTGGPATVFEPNAPALDNAIFELGLPQSRGPRVRQGGADARRHESAVRRR